MKATLTTPLIKKLLAGSLIFYALSGISSLLNYAFYPVIARFVTTQEYGEIQFLVSMFTQLAVGFVVLNILAIIIGAELKSSEAQKKAAHSLNIVAGTVTAIIVLVGSFILLTQKDTLGLTSSTAVIALGLSLLVNVPFTVAVGNLQGNDRFGLSGIVSMLAALLKLIFSLLFVILGYGVAGAIFGIFTGMLACLCLAAFINYFSSPTLKPEKLRTAKYHLSNLVFVRDRAIIALVAVTLVTLLSAADSIVSRIVLSASEAGQYAAVATIAKMILAATSPLMWLALPPAIQRDTKRIVKYTGIALAISLIATAIFSLAPAFFTKIVIGIDAEAFTSLLPLASIGTSMCAIAFIILTATVCLGYLRQTLLVALVGTSIFFATLAILSPTQGLLVAALYGQITASLCFIAGLVSKLRTYDPKGYRSN